MWRYPFNLLLGLFGLFAFFALAYGASSLVFGPEALASANLPGLVAGYAAWMLALTALTQGQSEIQTDAQIGVIESVATSGSSLQEVTGIRVLAALTTSSVVVVIVTIVLCALLDVVLRLSASFFFCMGLVCAAYLGLGFFVAGLTLLYKRVEVAIVPFQFLMLFVFAMPLSDLGAAIRVMDALPGYLPLQHLKALASGDPGPAPLDWLFSASMAAVYLLAGVAAFRAMNHRARSLGSIGQH
jgi:ABC-2 type transport system permease protein